jgi:cation:H+ antiporter
MLTNIILLIIGFVLLVKGADIFVDGSAGLARNFKIHPLIIGLTIVACGTSAPELAVSTLSAIRGSSEIAISNIVGSNLFNLLGILGLCAMIYPLQVSNGIIKRDFPVSIIGTSVTFLVVGGWMLFDHFAHYKSGHSMAINVGTVCRGVGVVLVLAYIIYVLALINHEKANPAPPETAIRLLTIRRCIALIIIGLIMIIAGGQLVVNSSQTIALSLGISETLIGLTIVAIGTSLPELATSFIATKKGQLDLAIGNVIGSNIFNLFFILGLTSIIQPVAVNLATLIDMLILIITSILVLLFCFRTKRINNVSGFFMVLIYIAIVIFAVNR